MRIQHLALLALAVIGILAFVVLRQYFFNPPAAPSGPISQRDRDRINEVRDSGLEVPSHAPGREPFELERPEEPQVASLTVKVQHVDGQPVEATVIWYGPDSKLDLGRTNLMGHLVLDTRRVRRGCLQAVAQEKWSETVYVDDGESGVVLIRTLPGGVLEGTVLDPMGIPVGGATVLLWPSSQRFPMLQQVWTGLIGSPDTRATATEDSGYFRFDSLDTRMTYDLAAGTQGLLTAAPLTGLKPNSGSISVKLTQISAVQVEIVEYGGLQLPSSPELSPNGLVMFRLGEHHPGVKKAPEWLAPLCGLVPPEAEQAAYSTLLFYESPNADSVGPIDCQIHIPGYVPQSRKFYAVPWNGVLSKERIELMPLSTDRGDLEIVFTQSGLLDPAENTRVQPLAAVHLESDQGERYEYLLAGFSSDSKVIRGVPAGTYAARICSRTSPFVWPPLDSPAPSIQISSQSPAKLEVDCEALGGLEAEIEDSQGVSYRGPATIVFVPVNGPVSNEYSTIMFEVDFQHAPYIIGGLVAGHYKVASRFPRAVMKREESSAGVEIRTNASTPITLRLEPKN